MAKDKKKRKAEGGFFGYVIDPIMKARVDLLMKTMPPNRNAAQLIHGLHAIGYRITAVPMDGISTRITGAEHVISAADALKLAMPQRAPTMPPAGPMPPATPHPLNTPAPPIDAKRARPKHRPGAVKRKAKGKAGDTGFA